MAAISPEFAAASADLRWAMGVATFAELLRRSPHTTEVRWADVLAMVEGALDPADPDRVELRDLVVRAAELGGGLEATMAAEPVATSDR